SNPKVAALTRPVRMRHRSTASWRATATMAFLRAAPVARGPTPQHLFPFDDWFVIGLEPRKLSGQANSTKAARKRGLPCLVTQLCSRVFPLEYSPGQSPVQLAI